MIDKLHFQELASKDPMDVCRRAGCKYDDENSSYTLSVWGDDFRIYPHQFKIDCESSKHCNLHDYFYLVIIHYLLWAKEIAVLDEWISEKDIPGGTTFFRGPHQIPTALISERFGNNLDGFKQRCGQLHGSPLDMADTAFAFEITSRVPVAVLYWVGDDDFPAESKILYDRTITEHLASDVIYALAVGICQRLSLW